MVVSSREVGLSSGDGFIETVNNQIWLGQAFFYKWKRNMLNLIVCWVFDMWWSELKIKLKCV